MGFVLRTAIAVGIVYAISPLRESQPGADELAAQARAAVAGQASRAVDAAVALCLKDKAKCALLGLPAAGVPEPPQGPARATAEARMIPEPPPRPASKPHGTGPKD